MKNWFKTLALTALAATALITGCSSDSSDLSSPLGLDSPSAHVGGGSGVDVAGDGAYGAKAPEWTTRHTGTPEPWMLDVLEDFQTLLENLGSSDPDVAAAAAQELMSLDPDIYPDALRALTADAPDFVQQTVEEDIAAYWEQYGGRPELANRGGGEWTFQIKGEVRTKPPSTVTVNTFVYSHEEDVSGKKFPFDTGESAHTCQRLVLESETGVEQYPYHLKFTIPGNLWITSIDIDLNLEIDLTLIIRYYECPPDGGEEGGKDGDEERRPAPVLAETF